MSPRPLTYYGLLHGQKSSTKSACLAPRFPRLVTYFSKSFILCMICQYKPLGAGKARLATHMPYRSQCFWHLTFLRR